MAIDWKWTHVEKIPEECPLVDFPGNFCISCSLRILGSRVINPEEAEEKGSDWDWVVLVEQNCFLKTIKTGLENGWDAEGDEDLLLKGEVDFVSLRSENKNLIIVKDLEFFNLFVLATRVAKELKLDTRKKRVCLFQAILYDTFKPLDVCEGRYRDRRN